jgi:hypothetical protein
MNVSQHGTAPSMINSIGALNFATITIERFSGHAGIISL